MAITVVLTPAKVFFDNIEESVTAIERVELQHRDDGTSCVLLMYVFGDKFEEYSDVMISARSGEKYLYFYSNQLL